MNNALHGGQVSDGPRWAEYTQLVGAAPEMLKALQMAHGWIDAQVTTSNDVSDYDIEVVNCVKAAIARATE